MVLGQEEDRKSFVVASTVVLRRWTCCAMRRVNCRSQRGAAALDWQKHGDPSATARASTHDDIMCEACTLWRLHLVFYTDERDPKDHF